MSGVKTFSNETSERYALALLELSVENSEIDIIEKNILSLIELTKKNSYLSNFLKNPTHNIEIQKKIFSEISKIMSLNKTLSNFLLLIIQKRRIFYLDKILEKFIKLSSKKKGIIDAILISSKELSQSEKDLINKEVSNAVNSNLEFSFKLDKKLISGVKIQVGSLLIDTSLSNKLRKTKQAMLE